MFCASPRWSPGGADHRDVLRIFRIGRDWTDIDLIRTGHDTGFEVLLRLAATS